MRHARSITYRVGARGAMLLILAALWVRLFVYPLATGSSATPEGVFYYTWPTELRMTMWVVTIAAAVVAAFVVPRRDWFGWVALTVMPTQRLAAWITAWVEGALPGGSPGHPHAAAQVALYALLVAAVFVASSMRPASMDQAAADGGDTTPGST